MSVPWIPHCSSGPNYGLGQLLVTWYPGLGEVTIDKADPLIMVTGLLLDAIATGRSPGARITKTCACSPGFNCPHYQGAKLEIRGRNRKVIYIIGLPILGDLPEPLAWEAGWPD